MSEYGVLLTIDEVMKMLSVSSKNTVMNMVKDGRFPKPIYLSKKIVRWRQSDLNDFIESMGR